MSSFLASVKADLMGPRLRLVVILLGIGLLAAVGYVAFGGKSSSTPVPAGGSAAVPSSAVLGGLTISQAPTNPNLVTAETTDGAADERTGVSRNPFTPLPEAGATGTTGATGASTPGTSTSSASTTTSSSSSSSSSSSGSGSSTTPSGGTTPVAKAKPAPTKTKSAVHYNVAAQFGVIATPPAEGAAPASPTASIPALKTYLDLPLDEPLPNKSNPQLVYLGVVLHTGKSAVFALAGEAILHGSAVCLPSTTQCQTIQLQPGQSETLEAVEANGTPVTYELKLISIEKSEKSSTTGAHASARAHAASRSAVTAARGLLRRRGGVTALSGLEYSHIPGVLVFAAHRAPHANARAAAGRRRHGR
jgi:hypothetical protein